jgi:hypothetical protein
LASVPCAVQKAVLARHQDHQRRWDAASKVFPAQAAEAAWADPVVDHWNGNPVWYLEQARDCRLAAGRDFL